MEVFRASGAGIADLNQWIGRVFRPFFALPGAFEKAVEAAFVQARADGVSRLEMSIDVCFGTMFHVSSDHIVAVLKHCHQTVAPEIDFRPELGFSRSVPADTLMAAFEQFLHYHYFRSVDLYDDEFAQPVGNFKTLYRYAREQGLKCKAHAGEFGSADSVREAVETLQLDAVQHGISAADSREVMKWLADNRIPLNVCPTSNIKLKVVKSFRVHPVRILADHGVQVSVNTDDALVFGDGVSEQYLKLYKAGVFSAAELDIIRQNGLEI